MYALEGGSFGFQIGGEATDLILLVMNDRGMESILSSKVKLGADASVAGGPVGRDASADTDAWMREEILSYSRSRGLFAGISLEGTTLRPDVEASELVGHAVTAKEIVRGEKTHVSAAGRHLVDVLEKSAPHKRIEGSRFDRVVGLPACRDPLIPASYLARTSAKSENVKIDFRRLACGKQFTASVYQEQSIQRSGGRVAADNNEPSEGGRLVHSFGAN